MNDAEIAGYMDWRGPGAYTERQLVRIRRIVEEVKRREREACAKVCDDLPAPDSCSGSESSLWDVATLECGDAIRARGGNAA
jgi:hypothetical protein